MPDPNEPNPNAAPPNNGEPTPSLPASGNAPPAPEPWKPGPGAPAWAVGKTADEILALAQRMATEWVPREQTPTPTQQPRQVTDDDFIQRPLEASERVVAAGMAPMNTALQGLAAQQASITRSLMAQQYKDTFDKWGAEVDAAMQNVAIELRTPENYLKVIKYVRGNHEDEIATDKARQMMATGALGERATGANGLQVSSTQGFNIDKLRPDTQEYIRKHGLTAQHVADFCKANGWTEEKFMTEMLNNKMFTQDSPFSFQLKEEALGATRQFA